jgi:hypothetical protein
VVILQHLKDSLVDRENKLHLIEEYKRQAEAAKLQTKDGLLREMLSKMDPNE